MRFGVPLTQTWPEQTLETESHYLERQSVPKGKRGAARPEADAAIASAQPTDVPSDATLTIAELAEYLRVHRTTISRLLRAGRIPGIRAGKLWRIDRGAIDKWERERTASSDTESSLPPKRKARKAREPKRR